MWLFAIILLDFVALLVVYALWGRPWLKQQPWAQPFFTWIEPFELVLYKKSETILMGRLLWAGGGFVTLYDSVAAFIPSLDLSPLTTRIFDGLHIPADMRGLIGSAFIAGIGLVINWLRKRTTKPIEIVAMPESQMTPEAAHAIEAADAAKAQAVLAVTEAKAA
jgi:hypothetical protein